MNIQCPVIGIDRCRIESYNEAQLRVIPFVSEDVNVVISLGTGTGKTVMAGCLAGYSSSIGAKMVYCAPLKSICSAQYEEWCLLPCLEGNCVLATGETNTDIQSLKDAGLITATTLQDAAQRSSDLAGGK